MPQKRKCHLNRKPSRLPQILAIGGLALLVVVILAFKDKSQTAVPTVTTAQTTGNELPQAQLDRALAENRPTLAFFHSTDCHQCQVMMETVAQVFPEYTNSITLVDINVYDQRNAQVLREYKIQYIPTLIFFDRTGQNKVSVGVLEAEKLRQTLAALTTGE